MDALFELDKSINNGDETRGKSYNELLKKTNQEIGAFAKGVQVVKHKELIELGIGIHTQCEGCIVSHGTAVLKAGATREEIVEAIQAAIYMGGGPCVIYGAKAYAFLQGFEGAE